MPEARQEHVDVTSCVCIVRCKKNRFNRAPLVEVMACEGGCVGGAGVLGEKNRTTKAIQKFIKA